MRGASGVGWVEFVASPFLSFPFTNDVSKTKVIILAFQVGK